MIRIRRLRIVLAAARRSEALPVARGAADALAARLRPDDGAAARAETRIEGGGEPAPILARRIGAAVAAAVALRRR
jgi:hypothetical protein